MLVVISWTIGVLLPLIHLVVLLPLTLLYIPENQSLFLVIYITRISKDKGLSEVFMHLENFLLMNSLMAVLKLACTDTHIHETVVLAGMISVLVGHFSIVISYMCVLCAIFRIQPGERQRKALSTCSSHLCVVGLFHGIAIIMYVGPRYGNPREQKKYLFLFHRLFNPMLNPLIYTLRNSEVKNALRRVLGIERAL